MAHFSFPPPFLSPFPFQLAGVLFCPSRRPCLVFPRDHGFLFCEALPPLQHLFFFLWKDGHGEPFPFFSLPGHIKNSPFPSSPLFPAIELSSPRKKCKCSPNASMSLKARLRSPLFPDLPFFPLPPCRQYEPDISPTFLSELDSFLPSPTCKPLLPDVPLLFPTGFVNNVSPNTVKDPVSSRLIPDQYSPPPSPKDSL